MEERFNSNLVFNSFLILIPVNLFIIFLMTLYRLFFLFYFGDFSVLSASKIYVLKAFFMGLRFDMSIMAYINAPVTLILILCLLLQSYSIFRFSISLFRYYYTLIFSLLFLVIFVDFGFFSYFKDHYNLLIFGIFEDDTIALIKTIAADYRLYIALIIFGLLCFVINKVCYFTYKELKFNERIINTLYWKKSTKALIVLMIITLNFVVARGSFSMFPLGIFYSQISPDYFINKLCINPVHPLADTVYFKIKNANNKMNLKDVFGYPGEEQILNDLRFLSFNADKQTIPDYFHKKTGENKTAERIKPNVILIVMEGFGELPVLKDSPKFNVLGDLKKHFENDTVFYNFLPAGFITIHGIESIILNIPQRPFVNQITQTKDAFRLFPNSAVLPYKKAGYDSIALYGGSMTWRDLESFFKVQGFDEIVGEGNIKVKAKDKHAWGINDAQFFELLKEKLEDKSSNKPKFIFAMSTGTHPPYKRPDGYSPLPLEIPQQIKGMMSSKDFNNKAIFELYQFANMELAKFISAVKESEFGKNTIIAVTGDHNLRELSNYSPEDMFVRYAVPFYLYIPQKLKSKEINTAVNGSHMDIMPTLYGLSLSNADYTSVGNDLININDNVSLNIAGLAVKDNIAIEYNFTDKTFKSFDFNTKTKKLSPSDQTEEHKKLADYYKAVMTASDILMKK